MKLSTCVQTSTRNQQKGVALVIVLGCLVLLSTLVVAFMASISGEYATSKVYAAGASTRFLSDSAVNAVMGQIAEATRGIAAGTTKRMTWASQPGMIRTYDDTGATGNAFKLYSSRNMMVGANTNLKLEMVEDVPAGWQTKPAIFTDINAPVRDAEQKLRFPIIDGNLKQLSVNGKPTLTYDVDGNGVPDIEGFGIDPASVPNYQEGSDISGTNNPAPMPAQWIYVLKDGSLVSPDQGGGLTATFSGANQPTKENPIAGRIAFWTDDETSKLNINTACEGTYYAFPHTNGQTDMQSLAPGSKKFGFAVSPPSNGEYNRYPGHPATTCLSVALGKWLDGANASTPPTAYTSKVSDDRYLNNTLPEYLSLSPRNVLGGSRSGTVDSASLGVIAADADRLYASVDELKFKPNRDQNTKLNNDALEQLRFFLTASSRAPELTPFNTPKVSLWPQWKSRADRDQFRQPSEKLLEFCSAIGVAPSPSGRNEYFFQRNLPRAAGGMQPSYMSSTQDWSQVPRNQQLANYLYQMGSNPIPGYGAAFVSPQKYQPATFSSIIVQCLDALRCNVGRMQYVLPGGGSGWEEYMAPLVVKSGLPGLSNATPAKGFGEYPIITQVALGLGMGPDPRPLPPQLPNTPPPPPYPPIPIIFLVFDTFSPMQSVPGINQPFNIRIENAENLGVKPFLGAPAVPPDSSNPYGFPAIPASPALSGSFTAGVWDWINNKTPAMRGYAWMFPNQYRFDNSGPTVSLGSGRPVTISLLDKDGGNVIQKITVTFDVTQAPTPDKNQRMAAGWYTTVSAMTSLKNGRASAVRSVECGSSSPVRGDWRLLGLTWDANQLGGADLFHKTKNYGNTALAQAHMLRLFNWGQQYLGDPIGQEPTVGNGVAWPATSTVTGSLVSGFSSSNYVDYQAPCVPEGITGVMGANGPGDWDTGPGLQPDGPYVNPTNQAFVSGTGIYFNPNFASSNTGGVEFSPNRLVASAIKFGSLPTGVYATQLEPWQTLLFCPNPASRKTAANGNPSANDHKGFANPPDHTLLEFFTMPTVEPYAISEPLSTAGKVNLNYQLAPYGNIERSTALRGVLKNTLMSGISGHNVKHPSAPGGHPNAWTGSSTYKLSSTAGSAMETRYEVNRDATLDGVKEMYFDKGKIFRYPSEVCDVFLVPKLIANGAYSGNAAKPPATYKDMLDWWVPKAPGDLTKMNFTGDNLREEPYDRIYPRLTTKSNTYTVHYRVQVLKKRTTTAANVWNEGVDNVLAESRGSTMIERYVDPSDASLNVQWDTDTLNLSVATNSKTDLSKLYKFRVISSKKFAP